MTNDTPDAIDDMRQNPTRFLTRAHEIIASYGKKVAPDANVDSVREKLRQPMTTETQTKLDRIKTACREAIALGEAATPGPWNDESDWPRVYSAGPRYVQVAQCCDRLVKRTKTGPTPDTTFIAQARQFSPAAAQALLVAIEALEAVALPMEGENRTRDQYAAHRTLEVIASTWPDA